MVFLLGGRGHREVSSSSKLLFSRHLSPTLKLQSVVGPRSPPVHYVVINKALHGNLTPVEPLLPRLTCLRYLFEDDPISIGNINRVA